MGSPILIHLMKIYALPQSVTVPKWKGEVGAFLSGFRYSTKTPAKEASVYRWLFSVDFESHYEGMVESLEYDVPQYGLEVIRKDVEAMCARIAHEITKNANRKQPLFFTKAAVNSWFQQES